MNKLVFTLLFLLQITMFARAQELKFSRIKASIPYVSLKVEGDMISLQGRKIELDKNGFPKQIQTFFTSEASSYSITPTNLLYENIHFHFIRKSDGKNTMLENGGIQFLKKTGRKVKWRSKNKNDSLIMDVTGSLTSDGFLVFTVKVKALQTVELKDVTLHIPFIQTVATHMMGFGIAEGKRPEKVEWKWNGGNKNQSGAWIGNVNAGLQYTLKEGAWINKGKGGVTIGIKGSSMLANNYTAEHTMQKGDALHYDFTLLVTPLYPVQSVNNN